MAGVTGVTGVTGVKGVTGVSWGSSFLGGLQRQARVTQDFKGTLDYIWFSPEAAYRSVTVKVR